MKVINFNGVWEKYRIKFIKQKNVCWEEIWVLEDINFQVEKGEVVGIVGRNGAGKTTLLKLIAGMLVPDRGEINVVGKVSVLMELGAGFNPEFTGRENLILNATIYGLSEADLKNRLEDIVEFVDLGKFIDAPIKYYSQGMYMRLAFALAIYVEPDILLIDDILAVGDEGTKRKCIKKIFELKQMGKTIILVSHDINMVSKLCNRLILLRKGKIIQEGLATKIIPYYLETVGDKRGIAVLEKEGLRIVFNNGKVTVNYNGFSLTKTMGGYVSFFVSPLNSWFPSFDLSWQVRRLGTDKIIVEGKSPEGILLQIWTLQIEKDRLKWEVEAKDAARQQPHIDLNLIPQYKRWQTLDKSSDFPLFVSKSNWQDLGLNSCPDAILGLSGDWQTQSCPGLILEQKNKNVLFKLFNTGYEQKSRVVQWDLGVSNKNSISIKIFSEKDKFTDYVNNVQQLFLQKQEEEKQKLLLDQQKEKQKLLLAQQKEQIRLRTQRTISYGDLRLYGDVDSKVLRLYYKDKEITRGGGLNSSFLIKTDWYDLSFGQWRLKKISGEKFILSVNFESLSISQVWTLVCHKDALTIKIRTKFNKPTSISNQLMFLHLCSRYEKWESAYEQGNFLNEQYIGDIAPVRLKDNKITEILFKPGNKDDVPKLVFCVFSQPERRTMNIHRYKQANEKMLCVNSSLIVYDKKKSTELDSTTCFEGKIVLGEKADIKKNTRKISSVQLVDNNLEFVFNQGKGGVSLGGKELTSGLGAYTSIRSSGVWYDSYQAFWRVNKKKNDQLKVTGYWPQIAVFQVWQIKITGDNLIFWQVDMGVSERLDLEICQTNIMLCPQYKNWIVSNCGYGKFLDEYTQKYDILPFRFWYGKGEEIIAKADTETLPRISFKNDTKKAKLRTIVENTDNLYQARLLQYQKENVHKILPGKYSYFKGIIKIEP